MPIFVKASRRARAYVRSAGAKFGKVASSLSKKPKVAKSWAKFDARQSRNNLAKAARDRAHQIQANRLKYVGK